MMIRTFGAAEYRRVVTYYLQKHAYGNVETNDLYQAFQDVLGLTPDWFFNEWIYRGGEPAYSIRYEDVRGIPGRESVFTVAQTHEQDELVGLFRMPLDFEVHYIDGTSDRLRQVIADQTTKVTIPNPGSRVVSFVLFDPGSWILKSVDFAKPFPMLKAQALGAPQMIDRYDAIAAMRGLEIGSKRDILTQVYAREPFHALREEVLSQLTGDTDSRTTGLLRQALRDTAATVRRAALQACGAFPLSLKGDVERLLRDSSYSTVGAALELLCKRFPEETPRYLELTKDDHGTGNRVAVLRHEIGGAHGDTSSVARLLDYTGVSWDFMTRINALEALKRLGYCDEPLFPGLMSAMANPNGRLRAPAAAVAAYFMEQTSPAQKLKGYYRSHTWTPVERKLLDPYFK